MSMLPRSAAGRLRGETGPHRDPIGSCGQTIQRPFAAGSPADAPGDRLATSVSNQPRMGNRTEGSGRPEHVVPITTEKPTWTQ